MSDALDTQWPDTLMIRDTKIHDDLGGLGQRIYTTTGAGYNKVEYIRKDIYDELKTALNKLEASWDQAFP